MKFFKTTLVLLFIISNCIAQNQSEIDSLLNLEQQLQKKDNSISAAQKWQNDSVLFNVYSSLRRKFERKDFAKAKDYATKMHNLSIKTRNKKQQQRALLGLGISNEKIANYSEALNNYKELKQIAVQEKDTVMLMNGYLNEAIVYAKLSRNDDAIESYHIASKIALELKDYYMLGCAENNLGIFFKNQKQYEKSAESYTNALNAFQKKNDTMATASLGANLAELYLLTGQLDQAVYYSQLTTKLSAAINDKYLLANGNNILGKIYAAKKEYDTALLYFDSAKTLRITISDKLGQGEILIDMANSLFAKNDYAKAKTSALEGLKISQSVGSVEFQRNAHQVLAQIYEAEHSYALSLDAFKNFKMMDDSIFSIEKNKKLTELELNFDFEKRSDSINVQHQLAIADIVHQNKTKTTIRNAMIIAGCLIIIALVLLLFQRSKLAKLQRQKSIEEERFRISRDLHDGLGAGATGILMLSQQMQNNTTQDNNHRYIEKIKNTSLEMVEQMSDIVWALNTKNDTLENLLLYARSFADDFFEDSATQLSFHFPQTIIDKKMTGLERRNIFMAFKEALNNIRKYAHAQQVEITFAATLNGFSFKAIDNGKGFEIDTARQLGNGLKNAKSRMEEIGGNYFIKSEIGKGTEVELQFA